MPLFSERIAGWSSIADTFVSFFQNQPNSFWLDREHHHDSRYSVIGVGSYTQTLQSTELAEENQALPFSFRPGFVGVVKYRSEETAPLEVSGIDVDRAFVFDHDNRAMFFMGEFQNRNEFNEWFHAALLRLALVGGDAAGYLMAHDQASAAGLNALDSKDQYLGKIERAKEHISSGDVYQICLTTELSGDFVGDPLALFLRLRKQHPAPYCSYLKTENATYLSISPERFISVTGNHVMSSPIKGTRERSEDPAEDLVLQNSLGADNKERAENLMIVDLIRNDLSSVCTAGSIKVDSLLAVRSYSTVHQLVSDISGDLEADKTGFDALQALFPGGSMTGAPKISACRILTDLEARERGAYSGGIGWISKTGDMDLGMVIRTAIFEGTTVKLAIGGGITADSVPETEHAEIQLKAKALVAALSAKVTW